MPANTAARDTEGAQYLKRPQFHKRFTLPATADHDALEVGYSDLGCQPTAGAEPPVVLFMPGMFASRFYGALMGVVGERMGVRVLTVDRPGIGYSTDVKLVKRVDVWVELVPQLLVHLGIQHVSLVSHSAGVIHLLNTLYGCRDVLSPTRPYAAILAPWVDVKHSGVKMLQAAQLVPSIAFGSLNSLIKAMATIVPVVGSSVGFVGKWLSESTPESRSEISENRLHWQKRYAVSNEFLDTILDASLEAMYAENTAGANSEVRLCLKKEGDGTWGACEDFEVFVSTLAARERSRGLGPKISVKMLFAEDDPMIGEVGKRYMESCWDCEGKFGDVLGFASAGVEGADHNSIVTLVAVLEEILGDVVSGDDAATS